MQKYLLAIYSTGELAYDYLEKRGFDTKALRSWRMDHITIPAHVGEDRRLVIELPENAPIGDVELTIRAVEPPKQVENPKRDDVC